MRSITSTYRTAFAIAIDLSGSMSEMIHYKRAMRSKAEAAKDVINIFIAEMLERARREEGVRDYYDLAIWGYAGDSTSSLLGSEKSPFVSICQVERLSLEQSDKTPFKWIKSEASGLTPMYEVLWQIDKHIAEWCRQNQNSHPPLVINITDGEATDCEWQWLVRISEQIKSHSTYGGNVQLINVHLSSEVGATSLIFPTLEEIISSNNHYVMALNSSASYMPSSLQEAICAIKGISPNEQRFKSIAYNASIEELLSILNIGSISVKRG
ncbi:MAG: vWA domain-containing protein [Rikenellaceae bacterium]